MRIIKAIVYCSLISICWGLCNNTYNVEIGDTCFSISQRVGVSVQDLHDLNPIINDYCSNLQPGQEICISYDESEEEDNLGMIYSIWHCGTDCAWTSKPDLTQSAWILNRGDGKPTTDVVILSFMDPLSLLNNQNGNGYTDGVPTGMVQSYSYFTGKGIRVIFSIGGQAWSDKFLQALQKNAAQLAKNAAAAAKKYDVGIEIDIEIDNNSYNSQLTTFVTTFRQLIPYDQSATAPSHTILTMDVGAGTGFLGNLATLAREWVKDNKLNWVNAMVSDAPWPNIGQATAAWQQHLTAGLPANRLVVSQYGSNTCVAYQGLLQQTVEWVESKKGRGISFWAAGSGGGVYVHDCKGIEEGSKAFLK